MSLNSATITLSLLNEATQNQFVKIANLFSYVLRDLTNEAETEDDSIFDFSTIFD